MRAAFAVAFRGPVGFMSYFYAIFKVGGVAPFLSHLHQMPLWVLMATVVGTLAFSVMNLQWTIQMVKRLFKPLEKEAVE